MTDDQDGFTAPLMQRPTPTAVRLAGQRLHAYATANGVPRDVPIVTMPLVGQPDEVETLARDQRLLTWFVSLR